MNTIDTIFAVLCIITLGLALAVFAVMAWSTKESKKIAEEEKEKLPTWARGVLK